MTSDILKRKRETPKQEQMNDAIRSMSRLFISQPTKKRTKSEPRTAMTSMQANTDYLISMHRYVVLTFRQFYVLFFNVGNQNI